jgi:hypothetical protein
MTGAWLIITVGNQALWATLPHLTATISAIRGKPMWHGQHLYIPTYHPAYALRNPEAKETISFDLDKAVRIISGLAQAPVPKSFDPSIMISALRSSPLTSIESTRFASHFKKHGWVSAYSHWLEDKIVCTRDDMVNVPAHIEGVHYTVPELIQLSHFDRSWETARRIHYTKREFGATIV